MKHCPSCTGYNFVGVSYWNPREISIKCGICNFEGQRKPTLKEAKEAWDSFKRK